MFKIVDFESFKKHRDLGMFDKLYVIEQNLTDDEEEQLGEWLSMNCSKNFIMTKQTSKIYAGGYHDNIAGWASRHIVGYNEEQRDYQVKLYQEDVVLFEMVWLTK